ncbi:XdhC family protein [Aquimarina sp. 2201CG5-10]|uniref:XdhC family protein n=1 Tax=Aquimarina callyspongiae TaxID=3098150 RepID=UPI002AB54778|nr:XdhC family protein [Aquimarina sp. 2201CG5-10]MDY8136357.1 XdhC family protein [Aquimarina sp. 2201CG5-10]
MTHEFIEIIESYRIAKQQGIPAVMVTVVDVEGSSYRRAGVRMLILQNNKMIGAVSGGCVEKEALRQSQSVFKTGAPKIMTYDGKYRLGCEGVLFMLIEPFKISDQVIETIQQHFRSRKPFILQSYYSKKLKEYNQMGSVIQLSDNQEFSFSKETNLDESLDCFINEMKPSFRLIIIGAEHDAVKLCQLASLSGWEVTVVGSSKDPKKLEDFPGAYQIINTSPEEIVIDNIDEQTAIILMSHNFAKDLLYLQAIKDEKPVYIGLLGPAKRREKLLNAFIDYFPDVDDVFLDSIHGPAGLNLGAETPQEIAISILAEILSVIRSQKPIPLQEKKGAIHDDPKRKNINVISTNI